MYKGLKVKILAKQVLKTQVLISGLFLYSGLSYDMSFLVRVTS